MSIIIKGKNWKWVDSGNCVGCSCSDEKSNIELIPLTSDELLYAKTEQTTEVLVLTNMLAASQLHLPIIAILPKKEIPSGKSVELPEKIPANESVSINLYNIRNAVNNILDYLKAKEGE